MNDSRTPILQDKLPRGQAEVAAARLPLMRPVVGQWLTFDGAYGAQMGERRRLLQSCEADVGLLPRRRFRRHQLPEPRGVLALTHPTEPLSVVQLAFAASVASASMLDAI